MRTALESGLSAVKMPVVDTNTARFTCARSAGSDDRGGMPETERRYADEHVDRILPKHGIDRVRVVEIGVCATGAGAFDHMPGRVGSGGRGDVVAPPY